MIRGISHSIAHSFLAIARPIVANKRIEIYKYR